MKEYAEKANFWHYIWKEDGRKRSGVLADIRRTRAQYYSAIRRVNLMGYKNMQCTLQSDVEQT